MADLTIPLIGITTLVGYFFSKNGKVEREQSTNRTKIETFDKPNGDNIYTSNVVTEANNEILNRSLQNYKDAQNPSETGFLPPLYNTYSAIGITQSEVDKNIKSLSSKELGELNDKNRIGKVESLVDSGIEKMPMFRSGVQEKQEILGLRENINALTGLPYESDHNNMVPFFGSNAKQNMEGFANSGILDKYTGKTFEFEHKKEVESFYDTKPENIYGTQPQTDAIKDRYVQSIYKQGEKPIESVYISAPKAGTFENNIRPEFKTINELRPGSNPKQTYSGVTVPGQFGTTRGLVGEVKKNGPPTFYEKSSDNLFKGPGAFVAPKVLEDYSINFKTSSRDQYNIEYYGNVNTTNFNKLPQRTGHIDNSRELLEVFEISDSLVQEPKRINFENDYVRNISGSKTSNDYGRSSMKQYTNERSTTEDQFDMGNITLPGKQVVIKPLDDAKTTLKQTTLRTNDSGNIKTIYKLNSTDPYESGMSDMKPKNTQKQNLIDNKYLGQYTNNQSGGLGYLVNKYDARITDKEIITNKSDYKGNPHYIHEFGSREQYNNADIRDDKQDLLMGQRAGGQQKFQISSGKVSFGEIKTKANLLLKEEQDIRYNMNTIVPQRIPDKNIINIQGNKIEASDDRFQPDLFKKQLAGNPYVIDSNK
jgi:hypothetical protein